MSKALEYDEIGYWSEIKLEIIKEYASAYSKILSSRRNPSFYHIYIDSFVKSRNLNLLLPYVAEVKEVNTHHIVVFNESSDFLRFHLY